MLASTVGGNVLALQQARSNIPVPVDTCLLQSSTANTTLRRVNAALKPFSKILSVHDAKARSGFLKRVVFRQGANTGTSADIMAMAVSETTPQPSTVDVCLVVNFITNGRGTSSQQDALAAVAESIAGAATCGGVGDQFTVTGVTQSIHVESNISAPPRSVQTLWGSPYVYANVCGVNYRVSPNAFFQVNSEQVQHLFRHILSAARLRSSDVALDLYCGTGAVALQLARHCRSVIGVDMVPSAVEDAQVNAQLNGISNVEFIVADLAGTSTQERRVLARLLAAEASVLILDPGRSGISGTVREFVMRHEHATRVVYVSCNSEKLSRDLRAFCAEGRWHCRMVQAVDMFPQTDHLEVVAVLERCER